MKRPDKLVVCVLSVKHTTRFLESTAFLHREQWCKKVHLLRVQGAESGQFTVNVDISVNASSVSIRHGDII